MNVCILWDEYLEQYHKGEISAETISQLKKKYDEALRDLTVYEYLQEKAEVYETLPEPGADFFYELDWYGNFQEEGLEQLLCTVSDTAAGVSSGNRGVSAYAAALPGMEIAWRVYGADSVEISAGTSADQCMVCGVARVIMCDTVHRLDKGVMSVVRE